MDSELLQAFIEEAESYLPTIRGGILVCVQDGKSHSELETSLKQIGTIKGAASMIGLEEIAEIAVELERELEPIFLRKEQVSDETLRSLLDKLALIEASLMTSRLNMGEFALDFSNFIEESFEHLQITPTIVEEKIEVQAEEAEMNEDSWEEEDFEIDEEMLEVFAMEAEDLLKNIASNLEILESQPDNREALMEIRRNAHTFKGSAGIVGLKKPSELAHRVEDLLDYLAENNIKSDEKIFLLLQGANDCLGALTSGENSPQMMKRIERIYEDFDQMMVSLTTPTITSEAIIKSAKIAHLAPVVQKTHIAADPQQRVFAERKPNSQAQVTNSKSVVRVALDRLDDLVKIVNGLVISRSVFEQRLAEFDRQIDELHHSTRRLQRSTNKLETDFEADMLEAKSFAVQSAPNGFQNPARSLRSKAAANEFDTLELDRYTDFHQTTRELVETTNDAFSINLSLDGLRSNLETLFDNQRRMIEELQNKLLRIRMVRFDTLTARLNRTIRVTCEEESKQADLLIEGENLEVDTQILDTLVEPLLHLLRNAVAHGIEAPDTRRLLGKPEKGNIHLRVHNEGTHIVLTVSDDGRGISASALKEKAIENRYISREDALAMIDEEAFDLIFLPGLTTAEKLSQVSGRGVGMNIVRTSVERNQGTINISSEPQKGTVFTIRMPMSLAVTRILLVKVNDHSFAFPLKLVKQITEISAEDLEKANHDKFLQLGSVKYSLSHLNDLLDMPVQVYKNRESFPLLLLENTDTPRALLIDEIVKPEEVLIKPLSHPLQNMAELLGATILGDGNVVPVLDLFYLLNQKKPKLRRPRKMVDDVIKAKTETKVLIVDDSPSVRHLNSKIVKNAGFKPLIAKDGLEALEVLNTANELPDVILTDVEMPRMDGYELLASLKKDGILQRIPVVMITSRANNKHQQKALELGAAEYLTKPFDDVKLVELIKRLANI